MTASPTSARRRRLSALVRSGEAYKIKASVSGEEFKPERHESKLLIKAATYHMLKVEKKDKEWEIDVIFDI